jgi:Domain of unknown function (DUF4349)
MTIHDEIDNFLAADSHGELSDEERNALHAHLVECGTCRQAHQETKIMNEILEEKLVSERPDAAFEQRMLGAFRDRAPKKTGTLPKLIVDLMRLHSAQIAAVAAVLLALVQIGRMITGGNGFPLPSQYGRDERVIVTGSKIPPAEETDEIRKAAPLASAGSPLGERNLGKVGERPAPRKLDSMAKAPTAQTSPAGAVSSLAYGGSAGLTQSRESSADLATTFREGTVPPPGANSLAESAQTPAAVEPGRKLIRNAKLELEVVSFDDGVAKISAFANEERGYIATSGSQKQANGKLRGEVVLKVLPENLDRFLQKLRGLGELKNQTIGTEDVTKAYFDTDARLKNARVMEQRLIDMLKAKTGKVSDLLQVEKELGRVREEIEKMQGELKYWDSQVQFATVTISLSEKDLEEPAAFLLKERTQLALYVNDVEKTYNDIKTLASPKVQITNAQLDRDNAGRVAAHLSMLIVPEESDAVVSRVKGMGRVENFQVQTERVAQGGNGMSENAKTKRDKVALNITISRETDEQPVQETSLRILTSNVDQNAARLKADAVKSGAEIRNSTFSRDPDGREVASISLRLPMKNYAAMMKSLNQLGAMKDVSVQRHDKIDKNPSQENAPADISIQIYSRGNIVSSDTALFATLRNTIAQGVGALMWSLRMIGVAIAFLAPWVVALVGVIWVTRRIARARNKT